MVAMGKIENVGLLWKSKFFNVLSQVLIKFALLCIFYNYYSIPENKISVDFFNLFVLLIMPNLFNKESQYSVRQEWHNC
jgi:hypothetical protein